MYSVSLNLVWRFECLESYQIAILESVIEGINNEQATLAAVSVLIVNWNSGRVLAECLQRLMVQTVQPSKSPSQDAPRLAPCCFMASILCCIESNCRSARGRAPFPLNKIEVTDT